MFRRLKTYYPVILLVAAMILTGLQSQALRHMPRQMPEPPRRQHVGDTLSHNDHRRYDYFFLEAIRQGNAGHYAAAFDLLRHCRDILPEEAATYYLLAMYHTELNNDSLALQYLERAAALDPGNDTYQERVAQYYTAMADYDKAITAYEHLYDRHHHRTDVLNILLQLYQQQKDYTQMLHTLTRLEQEEGSSEDIAVAKMRTYELLGDKQKAYQALKSLSDEHPHEQNYHIMMGNWLLQNDRKEEAFAIFTKALAEEPDNAYAQESLYDYYTEDGQDSLATALRERILTSRRTESKTRLTMLQEAIRHNEQQGGDSTEILKLFDRITETCPGDADIFTMKAAYMDLKKMPRDQVNQALRQVLAAAPDNAGARIEILQSLWPDQKWDEIIELCKPAVQYNPDEMAFYYFMGLAYFQKGDHDQALDAFRRGTSQINDQSNPEFVSDFYAIMGDILHKKGKDEEAFAAYDSCLQWKPDNISCLNNYAYYLSERDGDLNKAARMSFQTIQAEPSNATYLDTYAWILFRQERYAEALLYIDQAVACDTDTIRSAVIIEHAGDIHAKTGDTAQAIHYWQQALDMHDEDVDKALLRRKIRQKKYIRKK